MAPSTKVSRPRLARVLRVHQQHAPASRPWSQAGAQRRSEPVSWPVVWLLGASAGIAIPPVVNRLPENPLASLTRIIGRTASADSPTDSAPLGIRQAGPSRLLSAFSPSPAAHRAAPAPDPLVAVFSGLPSPFANGPALDLQPLPAPEAMTPPQQESEAPPFTATGSGASLLGGTLTLADRITDSLGSAPRIARHSQPIEADTTDPLPERWGEHLRALVRSTPLVLPVQVVRVRSADVQQTRTIPMALWPDGSATTNVSSPGPVGQQLAEDWVRQQTPLSEGSVRPVLMVLEPEAAPATADAGPAASPAPAPRTAQEVPAPAPSAPASASAALEPSGPAPEAQPVSSAAPSAAAELAGPELQAAAIAPAPLP